MEANANSVKTPQTYLVVVLFAFFFHDVIGCQDIPVGIADSSIIPDDRFTATSEYSNSNAPKTARLNGGAYGWAPSTPSNPTDYLQIDLGQVFVICAVATQGCNSCSERTTQYKISTSVDGIMWTTYKDGNIDKLFTGNTDSNTVVKNVLDVPILVRFIRFIPTAYHSWKTMRVEAYGFKKDFSWNTATPTVDNITSTSATVRWTQPAPSPSQSNVTSYVIQYQNSLHTQAINVPAPAVSYVITGLAVYTNYSVRIKAVSRFGHGQWSNFTNFTTVSANYPSTLATPTVDNIKSTSASVRWTQPAPSPSQGSVTSYVLQYRNSTYTQTINVSTPAVSHVITGLAVYTNYSVRIRAVSRVGPGQWSAGSNFTTDSTLPESPPGSVTANAITSQSIRVTWQAPSTGINGRLLGYKLACVEVSGSDVHKYTTSAESTSHTFSGLRKWTVYRITVKCVNDKGDGPASVEVTTRTLEDAPGQPHNVQVIVINYAGVRLDWALPSETNGIIRGFKLYHKNTGRFIEKTIYGNTTSSYVLNGLDKCTQYSFKMLAYTTKDGPNTTLTQETTAEDAPSAPTNLRESISKPNGPTVPQVTLTWDKPVVCGDNVGQYKVSYNHSDGVKVETVDRSKLTVTIPVWGGVTYWFRVRGVTNKEGPDSTSKVLAIPIYVPSASPSNLTLDGFNKTTFKLSWNRIPRSKSNGPIIKYEVNQTLVIRHRARRSGDPMSVMKQMTASCCSFYLHNLLVCAKYHISIRGYTSAGAGPFSYIQYLETSALGPPRDVNALSTTKREVSLQWQKPESVTEAIEEYTIAFEGKKDYNSSFKHNDSMTVSSTKKDVTNLYPDTRYVFWVSATTACGKGGNSRPSSTSTKVDAPPAPAVGLVSNITTEVNNITVWKSSDINGQIKAYQVIVVKVDTNSSFEETKLKSYEEAEKKDLHYYIAAQILVTGETFSEFFTLGNEKKYNGYKNVKLETGKQYHVSQRAMTEDWNKRYLAGPTSLIAKGKVIEGKGPSKDKQSHGTDTTCISLLAVSLTFNAAFLVFIVLLVLYIRKLKKQLEETNKIEKRSTADSGEVVYENKNTSEREEELVMTPLPANDGSTYEQINLRDKVDPSDIKVEVTRHNIIPADTGGGYYEPINNKPKPKPKHKPKPKAESQPKLHMYDTVRREEQTHNPNQNPAASSSQSPTYQSLVFEKPSKPVYQSLHTYGNTKINRDKDYEV